MISRKYVEISKLHKSEDSCRTAIERYLMLGGKESFIACEIATEKPESAIILGFEGYTHCLIPMVVIQGCKRHAGRYILDTEKAYLNKECLVSEIKIAVVIQKVILVICDDVSHRVIFEATRPWWHSVKANPVKSFLEPSTSWQQGYRV